MPYKGYVVEKAIVLDAGGIDQAVDKSNDQKDAILPVDACIIIGIGNVDQWRDKLCKTKIRRRNGN